MKFWKWLRILAFIAIVIYMVLDAQRFTEGIDSDRMAAQQDIRMICEAVERFKGEYQRLPRENGQASDLESSNAAIIQILTGAAKDQNPNGARFLEARRAEKRWGRWRRGLDPSSGALLDPWGNPYHIVLNSNAGISNPYSDFGPAHLMDDVIVWSLGKNGKQGRSNDERRYSGSDDVLSWRKR
jgi:hypothetical protein